MLTITYIERERQYALVARARAPLDQVATAAERSLRAVLSYAADRGIATSGAAFTRYLGLTEEGEFEVESGVPTLDAMPGGGIVESVELEGGEAATLLHEGPEGGLPAAHAMLDEHLEEAGLEPAGPRMESYLEPAAGRVPLRRTLLVQPIRRR